MTLTKSVGPSSTIPPLVDMHGIVYNRKFISKVGLTLWWYYQYTTKYKLANCKIKIKISDHSQWNHIQRQVNYTWILDRKPCNLGMLHQMHGHIWTHGMVLFECEPSIRLERNHERKHYKQMLHLNPFGTTRAIVSPSIYNLEPMFNFPPWI